MADAVSMSPRGLLNSDGNYAAQHQAMYDLLKYIQVGGSLPSDIEEYQRRLNLAPALLVVMKDVLVPLVDVYTQVKSDSGECEHITYPSILELADLTSEYARGAAGITGVSTYSHIFQCVRDLATATSEEEIGRLNREIDSFICAQTDLINALEERSSSCTENLRALDERMRRSQILVKERSDAVHRFASQMFPDATATESAILQLRTLLTQAIAPYEHDQLVECMPPYYLWLDLFGILSKSAIACVHGNDAKEIAILLVGFTFMLFSSNVIVADMIAIDTDLENVGTRTGVAINVVEQITGGWQAISGDLAHLLSMAKTDIHVANQYIARLNEKKIINDWKDLAEAVAKYQGAAQNFLRSNAFMSTSMADLARQLRAQAGQEDGAEH